MRFMKCFTQFETLTRRGFRTQTTKAHISCLNVPMARFSTTVSRNDRNAIMNVWPEVVKNLSVNEQYTDIVDGTKWLAKVLEYNVTDGKQFRGQSLVNAYTKLVPPEQCTDEKIRLASILAWSVELIHAHLLVLDDMMDHSTTRRGRPSWYCQDNIGIRAINDGILLEQSAYKLVRLHFKDKPYYVDIMDCLQENAYRATFGQLLDTKMSMDVGKKSNFKLFAMDKYHTIARYKTSYPTFVLPVQLAMYMAGIADPELHSLASGILARMGEFYQMQDDYLDCFADKSVFGKDGDDIREGKCTWLLLKAMERVTPEQRLILEDCYGTREPEKITRVKHLYIDLGLHEAYSTYEKETYAALHKDIEKISQDLPQEIFVQYLNKIYRRGK